MISFRQGFRNGWYTCGVLWSTFCVFVHPKPTQMKSQSVRVPKVWEVLNGVGVDGVGGIFPFLSFFFAFSFFFVSLRFSSLFFAFLRFSSFFFDILLEQRQTTAIYWENGEFHSDPVCTDPVRNFPKSFPERPEEKLFFFVRLQAQRTPLTHSPCSSLTQHGDKHQKGNPPRNPATQSFSACFLLMVMRARGNKCTKSYDNLCARPGNPFAQPPPT